MNEQVTGTIELLREKLQQQQADVVETKRMINSLLRMMGEEPEFVDLDSGPTVGPSRPDEYYGKAFATAASEYLTRRHRACSAEDIVAGLKAGGFDFSATGWREKDWLRMAAISLAKNNVKFHKLPNNTFGLLDWYPSVAAAKRAKSPSVEVTLNEEEESS